MPDVHYGMGATIGTVLPTVSAIIPAAVGVDIGCGMCAVRTSLHASQLPDNLRELRSLVENAIPHGRTHVRIVSSICLTAKPWLCVQLSRDSQHILMLRLATDIMSPIAGCFEYIYTQAVSIVLFADCHLIYRLFFIRADH